MCPTGGLTVSLSAVWDERSCNVGDSVPFRLAVISCQAPKDKAPGPFNSDLKHECALLAANYFKRLLDCIQCNKSSRASSGRRCQLHRVQDRARPAALSSTANSTGQREAGEGRGLQSQGCVIGLVTDLSIDRFYSLMIATLGK